MYYIMKDNSIVSTCSDLYAAKTYMKDKDESEYRILEDLRVAKNISRITTVDGEVIYNNKDFWMSKSQSVYDNFDEHTVLDFFGLPVTKDRLGIEMNLCRDRIAAIDGRAGQVDYNKVVGDEFISIFREECIMTDFKKESGITPLAIAQKLSSVISLVMTGSFREAAMSLKQIQALNTDAYLTVNRLQKYIDMLNAADVIEYATEADYFYTVPEEEE